MGYKVQSIYVQWVEGGGRPSIYLVKTCEESGVYIVGVGVHRIGATELIGLKKNDQLFFLVYLKKNDLIFFLVTF